MLTVSYKEEDCLGTVVCKGSDNKEYFCNIQKCNGLFAIVHFFTDDDGTKKVSLVDFAVDVKHFETCIKEYGDRYGGSWYLRIKHKESRDIAKSLLKYKIGFIIH